MKQKWQLWQQQFEHYASEFLKKQRIPSERLSQAITYSLLDGGKRMRAILVYLTGKMLDISFEKLHPMALAVEAIHAYSLVHDDLPAMDNDTMRRGKPTTHIAFDQATAILVGDGLQSLAYDALSQVDFPNTKMMQKAITLVARGTGPQGMVAGQQLDMDATNQDQTIEQLAQIHHYKTACLLQVAAGLPWYGSTYQSQPQIEQNLLVFAKSIGLAFQIQDDILDVTSDAQTLGKAAQHDIASNKATYPSILGLQGAKKALKDALILGDDALNKLSQQFDTAELAVFAQFIVHRTY